MELVMTNAEREIAKRQAPLAARIVVQSFALVFCTTGLAVRRSLWLLTSLSFVPLQSLAPAFRCKLRANVLASAIGFVVVFLSHRWGREPDALQIAALLGLASLYGTATTLAVQWPGTLEDVERWNARWPMRWFARRLRNPLDAAIVRQSLQIGIATLPGMVGVLVPSSFGPATVVLFLIGACASVTTGDNLVHIMVHNKPFMGGQHTNAVERAILRLFHWYTVVFVLPACFHNYPFYIFQHNHNHHIENNSADDTQTTLWYDRTSYLDFSRYAFRFAFTIMTAHDVLSYFAKKQKPKLFRRMLGGMLAYYAVIGMVAVINWRAAVFFLIGRFCLHAINQAGLGWYQHALFDPRDPTNDYTNSTNFAIPLEPFGAGLHGEHHVRMGRHWSTYMQAYEANPAYEEAIANELDPVVAQDFLALLFRREFARIGQLYTRGRERRTPEELHALVRERALAVLPDDRGPLAQAFDRGLTVFVTRTLIGRWAPR